MLTQTGKGLYCVSGGFHIDPSRSVELAVITHAHSDHARRGSQKYLCAAPGVSLLKSRVGINANVEGIPYGQGVQLGEVEISFHSAGHILGSAQIRVASRDSVWVASGDYKRESDPTCLAFEVVPCDTFITEGTFGHPSYVWAETTRVFEDIQEWWMQNRAVGRNSLLFCYALGKTQRVLAELTQFSSELVYLFGEAEALTRCYREQGVSMLPTRSLEEVHPSTTLKGELIIASQSISRSPWMARLGPLQTGFASGWMKGGGTSFSGFRGHYDRGFPISDHADWPSLLQTISETGARQILVQHASSGHLVRYLKDTGMVAQTFERPRRKPLTEAQGELF